MTRAGDSWHGNDGLPLSVTPEEIEAQRAAGWPDWHPETFCHRCGGRNVPSWAVDSDRFNAAFGPPDQHPYNGIVCPGCFVVAHEAAAGLTCTWRLVPDPGTPFRWRFDPGWYREDMAVADDAGSPDDASIGAERD